MFSRRSAAALLAAGLLLAGCSEDPEPRFSPTQSPSPTESETTAAPEAQSPEEFVREWFDLNTQMQNSGQTAEFLAASARCSACKSMATRVADIYDAGGYIEIESQRVLEIVPGSRSRTIKQFDVKVQASPTEYREKKGGNLRTLDGGTADVQVTIVKARGRWTMESLVGLA